MRILFAITLLALILIFLPEKKAPQTNPEKEKGHPMEPGWFDQYLAMRGRNGVIPSGVWNRIAERESANKTHTSNLINISELGPDDVGGRTRCIHYDFTNPNHIFAGGVSGGVWHSTNNGTSWQPVNDAQQTLSVTGFAQDYVNPEVFYFSTGESRGNSAGIPGSGIFKSTDSGVSFSQLPATNIPDFDYIWSIKTSPVQQNYLYAGTRSDGLFRSTDGGNSFDVVFCPDSGATTVNDIAVFPDGSVMIGVNAKGIYKSASGDTGTFVQLTTGLPDSSFYRIELDYCDSLPSTIYAGFEDNTGNLYYSGLKGVYKSTNAGSSWTAVSNPQNAGWMFDFPWYAFLLEVKPDDPDFVMCGSVDLTFSTNGGSTWSGAYYSHADNHVAAFSPTNSAFVMVGNDGGLYQYSTFTMAIQATSFNNSYNVTQFYAGGYYPAGDENLAGAQDNGTWKWNSGPGNFSSVFWGDGAYACVNQQNPLISYVSWQSGHINRADDSNNEYPSYYDTLGQLDSDMDGKVDEGAWFINPFEINLLDGDQLYFMTQTRLWRSLDGGLNWEPVTNSLKNGNQKSPLCIGISNSTSPVVYAGGEQAIFYRINNGVTSVPGSEVDLHASVPASVSNDFISSIEVDPFDEGALLVTFSTMSTEPRVWRVTDALSPNPVWTNVSGNLPQELPANWIEAHPTATATRWFLATDCGLYTTIDGGNTWDKETSIPNVAVHQVRLRNTDLKLFVYTHGRGIWTADVPPFVSADDPNSPEHITLYPNPAHDVIYISGTEAVTDYVIFDLQGKAVDAGRAISSVDVHALPKGAYVIMLMTDRGMEKMRFVKK